MIEKRSERILRRACVMMALAVVLLDLPKWAIVPAMIPAAVLLVHCAARIARKG